MTVEVYADARVAHPEYRENVLGKESVPEASFGNKTLHEYFEKYSRMSWLDFLCDTKGRTLFLKMRGNGLLEKAKTLNSQRWTDPQYVCVLA